MFDLRQTLAFKKWFEGLRDREAQRRIAMRIVRLEGGLFGDTKSVGEGVGELRIDFGPGYRIYFARRGTSIVLLLCGGDKSSQQSDIATAKALAAKWED